MNESRLEVHVEGRISAIPARAFLEVLRTSLNVLDQLERAENLSTKRPGKWLIAELRNESAIAVLRREDVAELQTPSRLVDGIRQLRHSQELPRYFSPAIALGLAKIGAHIRQEGVSGVNFRVTKTNEPPVEEHVTASVVANARASIEGAERAIGSVSGVLDVINLRRGHRKVSLYDDETRRAVRCQFPDTLFNTVKDALGRRVRAFGEVTRNRQGQILSVKITQIEMLPDLVPAPSVDELVGIAPWYTGDKPTDEYLRWTRHE